MDKNRENLRELMVRAIGFEKHNENWLKKKQELFDKLTDDKTSEAFNKLKIEIIRITSEQIKFANNLARNNLSQIHSKNKLSVSYGNFIKELTNVFTDLFKSIYSQRTELSSNKHVRHKIKGFISSFSSEKKYYSKYKDLKNRLTKLDSAIIPAKSDIIYEKIKKSHIIRNTGIFFIFFASIIAYGLFNKNYGTELFSQIIKYGWIPLLILLLYVFFSVRQLKKV